MMKKNPYSSTARRRLRLEVLERDGWQCQIRSDGCEAPNAGDLALEGAHPHVDHIVPASIDLYRFLDPGNCRAACRHCNSSRAGSLSYLQKNRSSRVW